MITTRITYKIYIFKQFLSIKVFISRFCFLLWSSTWHEKWLFHEEMEKPTLQLSHQSNSYRQYDCTGTRCIGPIGYEPPRPNSWIIYLLMLPLSKVAGIESVVIIQSLILNSKTWRMIGCAAKQTQIASWVSFPFSISNI